MNAAQTSPAINDAWGVIKILSGDERARALAESREKARMDLASYISDAKYEGRQAGLLEGLQEGRQAGRQEGRQEGRQAGLLEVAQNLLLKKMPPADVADATGLSLEEVKKLAAGLIQ